MTTWRGKRDILRWCWRQDRPALVLTAAVLLLPLAARWQARAPSLHVAVTETPALLLGLFGLVWIALVGARGDRAVAGFAAFTLVNAARVGADPAYATATHVLVGAALLAGARQCSASGRALVCGALVVVGAAEAAYALGQAWWGFNPLWHGWGPMLKRVPLGTIGNTAWLGAWLALLAPLAPWWLLPLFGLGIVVTQSSLALAAALVGTLIAWRPAFPPEWRRLIIGVQLAAAVVAFAGGLHLERLAAVVRGEGPVTMLGLVQASVGSGLERAVVWGAALWEWAHAGPLVLVFGFGPGLWFWRVPFLQLVGVEALRFEHYGQAHNEVVQLVYEQGLIGLGFLGWFLWRHRRACPDLRVGGAAVALAILSLGMFPFHLAELALPAVIVLGLAGPRQEPV